MKQKEEQTKSVLLNILEKYANRFFATLVAIICVALFFLGPQIAPDYTTAFVSIATSLAASLIFALIYSNIAERYHMMVVKDELSLGIKTVIEEATSYYRTLLPDEYFPPTNLPDERFNRVLMESLSKSHLYFFKGVTGRHIPSRLSEAMPRNTKCEVLLVDPRYDELLYAYIRDRFGAWNSEREQSERLQKVRKEIYMSIVSLYDQAHRIGMDIWIGLYRCPVFYRAELLSELVLISYFTEKTATAYPTTYLYKKDSFFYQVFYTDFRQTRDLTTSSINFNTKSTDQNLSQFLADIGCDISTIPKLREAAAEFKKEFQKALSLPSHHSP